MTTPQPITTGSAIIGTSATALTGAMQKLKSTPASMALASGAGIASTARPSGFQRPAITTSAPATMNAPTAAAKPPSTTPVAASNAAPGVDQAIAIGMRYLKPNTMAARPITVPSASNPDSA